MPDQHKLVNEYGRCNACDKDFVYGDKKVHIDLRVCSTSQGYPDEFVKGNTAHEYHAECLMDGEPNMLNQLVQFITRN